MNEKLCMVRPDELCKDDFRSVVALPVVWRQNGRESEVLVAEELNGNGWTKEPGDMCLAGTETGKRIGEVNEGGVSNVIGGLAGEVFHLVGDNEVVKFEIFRVGDFLFRDILVRFMLVEFLSEGLEVGFVDGETDNLRWIPVEELSSVGKWREGMEMILPLIPGLIGSFREGDGEKFVANGLTLRKFFRLRERHPDAGQRSL